VSRAVVPRERRSRGGAHGVVGIVHALGQELDGVGVLELTEPADRGAPDPGVGIRPQATPSGVS